MIGDHIWVQRSRYTHHGVLVGESSVIHYTGELGAKSDAAVARTTLDAFLQGGQLRFRQHVERHSVEDTIARAMSRLGERSYALTFNNCEHFATWCVLGASSSRQVENVGRLSTGTVAAAGAASAGGALVAGAGAAAGLAGGAGTMSGLATAGSLVGGGAAAGIAVVGVLPGVAAIATVHAILGDDEAEDASERQARRVGRTVAAGGAVAGSVGAVAMVSSAGAVAGLSGAGITSGLAALGGAGGMAAGIMVTAAAPAAATLGLGLLAYKAFQALSTKSK
jgi:hypothetical protein